MVRRASGSLKSLPPQPRAGASSASAAARNVASVAGVSGGAGQANYAAAKAGMLGLTRSVAREVATRGITVNAVVPGPVDTGILAHLPAGRRDQLRAAVPAGRFGTATEVAGAVAYLCGEDAAYVTGAILPVDGGMSMGH